jgi:ketosteroid isomerase-like protein
VSDPATEAIEAFHRWNNAFNARDAETQVSLMHFPHLRLAENRFQRWETADDFRAGQDDLTARLRAESWDHTDTLAIEAVQADNDKVHLVIRQSRRSADGAEYNGFDTLWIFTKIDGEWGVQFRSSFLASAASGRGSRPG